MSNKLKRGFTLVEIVIVLAIAALIMVVVFLAVQGAQRGQRNDTRRSVAGRVLAAAASYQGNNNGAFVAATFAGQIDSYLPPAERSIGGVNATVSAATSQASGATGCPVANQTIVGVGINGGRIYANICLEGGTGASTVWYQVSQ